MRKYLTKALLVLCCIMCYGTISNATATDKETKLTTINAPFVTMSEIYKNKTTVNKNEKLQYRFTLSFVDSYDYNQRKWFERPFLDSDHEVVLYWQSPKKQRIEKTYTWSKDRKTIIIEDSISIKDGIQVGEWELLSIQIVNDYDEDHADMIKIVDGTEEDQKTFGYETSYYTDLDCLNFIVTGVSAKVDNKAPTVDLKSLKISKRYIKENRKSQKTTFYVKVKDASTIEKVTCYWYLYNGKKLSKRQAEESSEYVMKYDKKKKRYKFTLKLNTKKYKKAELAGITMRDCYGNERYYSSYYDEGLPNPGKRKIYNAFNRIVVFAK